MPSVEQRPVVAASPKMPRDQRLDMFRGLALVMIFIDHAPGTLYENFTSRNFGFSDAAEAFVLMSGLAAGLAYTPGILARPLWPGISRVWARARVLYLVHLGTTLMALGIFAAGALWLNVPQVLQTNNIQPLFSQPLEVLVGLPLLTHQLGYFNILPLYLTMLLATPFVIMLAVRQPWLVLGASTLLWAAAGQFYLNFPNFPVSGGWFFNPLSWQLIFVVGLLSGVGMRQGRAFVQFHRPLLMAAIAFVVLVVVWQKVDAVGTFGRGLLGHVAGWGAPFYITWFDKTYLALPRLLHALALAYVLSSIPQIKTFSETRYAAPLTLLGRNGLPVFAVGSVLDMGLQVIKARIGQDWFNDAVLLLGGTFLLLALAWVLERNKPKRTNRGFEPLPAAPLATTRI